MESNTTCFSSFGVSKIVAIVDALQRQSLRRGGHARIVLPPQLAPPPPRGPFLRLVDRAAPFLRHPKQFRQPLLRHPSEPDLHRRPDHVPHHLVQRSLQQEVHSVIPLFPDEAQVISRRRRNNALAAASEAVILPQRLLHQLDSVNRPRRVHFPSRPPLVLLQLPPERLEVVRSLVQSQDGGEPRDVFLRERVRLRPRRFRKRGAVDEVRAGEAVRGIPQRGAEREAVGVPLRAGGLDRVPRPPPRPRLRHLIAVFFVRKIQRVLVALVIVRCSSGMPDVRGQLQIEHANVRREHPIHGVLQLVAKIIANLQLNVL
mmetsp:Transcript_26380/g.56085  ORF Transcript_26380/g.56085 Transcript_26380/m.56085 type:complete len:316 (-) Transcript_26380:682-1629(-)